MLLRIAILVQCSGIVIYHHFINYYYLFATAIAAISATTTTICAGECCGHSDDGDDQAVEERGAAEAGLEAVVADTRRGHPRGTQGIPGPGKYFGLFFLLTDLLVSLSANLLV